MSNSNLTFDQALTKYVGATQNAMELAAMCSLMALGHFAKHGDVSYVQRFFDATPKNYGRRAAFMQWACDFAPIKYEGGAFKKDHDRAENGENGAVVNVDLSGASAKHFWDYVPEKVATFYAANDVITQLKRVTGRFRNADKYKPEDDVAVKFLSAVDAKIGELETLVAAGNA